MVGALGFSNTFMMEKHIIPSYFINNYSMYNKLYLNSIHFFSHVFKKLKQKIKTKPIYLHIICKYFVLKIIIILALQVLSLNLSLRKHTSLD